MRLPEEFTGRIVSVHGGEGRVWLRELGGLLETAVRRFDLEALTPLDDLSFSFVATARTGEGRPVVVKSSPDPADLRAERSALEAFGPTRAVEVVGHLPGEPLLVLERVVPGSSLARTATEAEAATTVATLLAAGWPQEPRGSGCRPLAREMESLRRHRARARGAVTPLEPSTVERALRLFDELEGDAPEPRVLHGDLHYGNVLVSAELGPLLADPKGMVGDPAFDLGYLVTRPGPRGRDAPSLREAVDVRLDVLPDATGVDRARVAAWAYVAAVLSAAWALEDGTGGWEVAVEAAQVVRGLADL